MKTMTKQLDSAKKRTLDALEHAVSDRSTEAVRAAAEAVVALRALHDWEGRPDWAGRSPDYRLAIETLYRQAGVVSDSQGGIQANLRYHIGNVVRKTAPIVDLEALGMNADGPSERTRKARLAERRDSGRPSRPRTSANAVVVSVDAPGAALLAHATADVALARQALVHFTNVEHAAILSAAQTLLSDTLALVQELTQIGLAGGD